MNRRTALALVAALPGIASASPKSNKSRHAKTKKVDPSMPEFYEGQLLALFLALLVSKNYGASTPTYWVDSFRNSKGVRDDTDSYFTYTTDKAYAKAFDLLVAQGKYSSLLQFQKDYRGFSVEMMNYLAASDDPYPKICPLAINIENLLKQVG